MGAVPRGALLSNFSTSPQLSDLTAVLFNMFPKRTMGRAHVCSYFHNAGSKGSHFVRIRASNSNRLFRYML
jgi:hypothetical protein